MLNDYEDIRSKITQEPSWWDEVGVPRYCAFSPRVIAGVYADEAALIVVFCQGCGAAFKVAVSSSVTTDESVADAIRAKELRYGDPPNAGCCLAGPTMNSVPEKVLEYWRQRVEDAGDGDFLGWERDPEFEVDIRPEWSADWSRPESDGSDR